MSKCKTGVVLTTILLLLGSGCAGHRAFNVGENHFQQGQYDTAVVHYNRAIQENPNRHEFRMRLQKAKAAAAAQHLERGRTKVHKGDDFGAIADFSQAIAHDASLEVAHRELQQARNRLQTAELVREARQFRQGRKFVQARNALYEALLLSPGYAEAELLLELVQQDGQLLMDGVELDINSQKPITLKFNNTEIRDVFNILAKLSGINFIFDDDIRPQRINILLEDATFPQALEFLLNMNKLGKKVLNAKTIVIYPRNREKDKLYEDQVIQTFYLSNIDAKKAVNLLRTMLTLRKVYVHEELNALVIRDTTEVIKLAQQLLEAADRADSEVVFELELIEVNHGDTLNFGPKLSEYSVGAGLSKAGSGRIVNDTLTADTANLLTSLNGLQVFYTLPSAAFDLRKTMSDAEVLANPSIRVKNKEKAKVHIGSREPVITASFSGTDNRTTENVQYVDVGVKLDIEPLVQLDDTIFTKIALEVSSAVDKRATSGGSTVFTVTTTNAQTALTLKNGERTIIGGLIRDDSSKARTTVPLLGDLPLLGRLFTSHNNNKTKREILLSITPRIVKTVDIPRADAASIWSGGEDDLRAGRTFGTFTGNDVELGSARRGRLLPSDLAPAPAEAVLPEAVPAKAANLTPPTATGSPARAVVKPLAVKENEEEEESGVEAEKEAPPAMSSRIQEPVSVARAPDGPVLTRAYLRGPDTVHSGEEFVLVAEVDEMDRLFSAPLFVMYAAQNLEFVRAEEGDFLRRNGQATIFSSSADAGAGRVIIGLRQGTGGDGASGGGQLFRLIFRGTAPGVASVSLDRLNFRDPAGNRLSVESTGHKLEVR
jgi:general secretion pathway protein D